MDRAPQLVSGLLVVDPEAASVTFDGRPVGLQPQQFALLHRLMDSAGRTVGPQALIEAARLAGVKAPTTTLRSRINRLRATLTVGGAPDVIRMVWGGGYRFDAAVKRRPRPELPSPSTTASATASGEPLRVLSVGDVHLHLDGVQLRYGTARVDLAVTEFRLLHTLMAEAGRVCSKQRLTAAAWGSHRPGTGALGVWLRRTRGRLTQAGLPAALIRTVVNAGYVFDTAPLQRHRRRNEPPASGR